MRTTPRNHHVNHPTTQHTNTKDQPQPSPLTVPMRHPVVDDPDRLSGQLLSQQHILKEAQAVSGPIAPHACTGEAQREGDSERGGQEYKTGWST